MLGFDAIGRQPLGQGRSALTGAHIFVARSGSYVVTGVGLFFVRITASLSKTKLRLAKPALYQVRQFLGLLGR